MLEPYFNIQVCMKKYKNKVGSFLYLSPVLFVLALGEGAWLPVALCSGCGWKPDKLKVFALVHVGEGRRACVEPLDEVDLSLVLPCPGGFDGPPFPTERHIPAFILGILKSCIIVFQHNLWEDALPAPTVCLENRKTGSRVKSRGAESQHSSRTIKSEAKQSLQPINMFREVNLLGGSSVTSTPTLR